MRPIGKKDPGLELLCNDIGLETKNHVQKKTNSSVLTNQRATLVIIPPKERKNSDIRVMVVLEPCLFSKQNGAWDFIIMIRLSQFQSPFITCASCLLWQSINNLNQRTHLTVFVHCFLNGHIAQKYICSHHGFTVEKNTNASFGILLDDTTTLSHFYPPKPNDIAAAISCTTGTT